MNSFCRSLTDAIHFEFNINANIFVSKKKKIFHLSLHIPLIYYPYFLKNISLSENIGKIENIFVHNHILHNIQG